MSVDEIIGREFLQKSVNTPVSKMSGQSEKQVKSPQRAYSFEDLFLGRTREIGGDHFCRPSGSVDVGGQIPADGIDAVFLEKDPVEFAFYLFMGHFSPGSQRVYITVAGAVQCKMAQKAAEISVVRFAGSPLQKDLSRFCKILPAGEPVHTAAFSVKRMMGKGFVVKQQVRTVQADVEQVLFLQQDLSVFVIKRFEHILSEAVMSIGRGHWILPSDALFGAHT